MVVFRVVTFWTLFVTFTLLIFLKIAFYQLYGLLFLSHLERSHQAHRIACQWGSGVLKIVPGWKYKVEGLENTINGPAVLVANHQSAVDILAVYCTKLPFRWLSKATVFKIPIIGHSMRLAGYVPITRGNKRSHKEALVTSGNWLKNGVSMLFFPEGSRSKNGEIKPFKYGAFKLALSEGVPIQPILIHGTREMMEKNSFIPKPATVTIQVLPITHMLPNETVETYASRVEDQIKTAKQEQEKKG